MSVELRSHRPTFAKLKRWGPALWIGLVWSLLAPDLTAYGGTYLGPYNTVPPICKSCRRQPTKPCPLPNGPTLRYPSYQEESPPVGKRSSKSSDPIGLNTCRLGPDLTQWQFWWEHNKARFWAHAQHPREAFQKARDQGRNQFQEEVVRSLLSLLEKDAQDDQVSAALIALGKIGQDYEIYESILSYVSSPTPKIAESAILALGILGNPMAIPYLLNVLQSPALPPVTVSPNAAKFSNLKSFAAYALGLLAEQQEHSQQTQKIAESLWQAFRSSKHKEIDLKSACLLGLGLTTGKELSVWLPRMRTLCANSTLNPFVRAHAITAMAKMVRSRNYPEPFTTQTAHFLLQLIEQSQTPDLALSSCVQSLGIALPGNHDFAPKTLRILKQKAVSTFPRQARNFTAISIAYLGASAPHHSKVRTEVMRFFMQSLHHAESAYRPWIGLAIGVLARDLHNRYGERLPDEIAAQVLARFQETSNPNEYSAYAIALGLMQYEPAQKILFDVLSRTREVPENRYLAVALGLMGAAQYANPICAMIRKNQRIPDFVAQGLLGLGLLKDPFTWPILLQTLQASESQAFVVRAATAQALAAAADENGAKDLLAILQTAQQNSDQNSDRCETPWAKAFAAAALGKIFREQPLPWNHNIAADMNYRAAVPSLLADAANGVLQIL